MSNGKFKFLISLPSHDIFCQLQRAIHCDLLQKDTATALEANIYKSLVMGGQSAKVPESNVTVSSSSGAKSKKSSSAWSLSSKLATSNVSISSNKQTKKHTTDGALFTSS